MYELNALAQNKAVDAALKQVKAISPSTSAFFISTDPDAGKILAMAVVPKDVVAKGLKANEWCGAVQTIINGRGGGKPENAQASGTNVAGLAEAITVAVNFAKEKLGVEAPEIKK